MLFTADSKQCTALDLKSMLKTHLLDLVVTCAVTTSEVKTLWRNTNISQKSRFKNIQPKDLGAKIFFWKWHAVVHSDALLISL